MKFTLDFLSFAALVDGMGKMLPARSSLKLEAGNVKRVDAPEAAGVTGTSDYVWPIHVYGVSGKTSIRKRLPGFVIEPGDAVIPMEKAENFVKRVRGGYGGGREVLVKEIPDGSGAIVLECGNVAELIEKFPRFPVIDYGPNVFSMKLGELRAVMKRLGYAVASEERISLNGILFDLRVERMGTPGRMVIGATDGFRMAMQEYPVGSLVSCGTKDVRISVDFQSLKNIVNFFPEEKGGEKSEGREIDFHFHGDMITVFVRGEGDALTFVMMDTGTPPMIEQIIPNSFQFEYLVSRADFRSFLGGVKSTNSVHLCFLGNGKGLLGLLDKDTDLVYGRRQEFEYDVAPEFGNHSPDTGLYPEGFDLIVQAEYLREAVYACRSKELHLSFNTRLTPMVIRPVCGKFVEKHLLMPQNRSVPVGGANG